MKCQVSGARSQVTAAGRRRLVVYLAPGA